MQQAAADAAKKLENATEEAEETATRVSEGGGSTGSARSTGGLSGSTAAGDLVGPRHAAGGPYICIRRRPVFWVCCVFVTYDCSEVYQ